ncbi:flavonoid 3'-monooxygenase CYP75B137-like [Rosa rugosa]|uniref:flavonoid 3'-monooxygenase CYP75B137-like n=1 Tax=Rosa rugosa TaxID=74645 RepID=UPI002B40C493|nr:flavonoid 3'-monooxygenase CYP75B137-like [Rosa rugosa]XP_061988194.1 flavonoid 3'-monooxygenase CYP75B137-like [Rosa rugosa]XP_061988195.1 flavonoid 3'-monooxygenase CYP75B137-like [Rosa rugosa]XP_061988196.1 flavonoid 3'-monooxygenase CYP75B137-like [Rosa rugosa]XP_061988197.1 flavonoid 3'-monooxygenase CYP75B137-like [Rosa rugosa]XP_061988199.1 flavonoid 3'-monooxygenase CYP75B137-like [Rosa rugosa]XP_061988200.1 flavonoid 3'-monooxygenase CYP75B137-like [Rosa rugosa]XP_061988692.1 fla
MPHSYGFFMESSSLSSLWSETNSGSWGVFLTLSAIFAAFFYAWSCMRESKSSRMSPPLPPGPRGLPLVGNLLSLDPELHSYFAGLAKTYGPIFKLRLGTRLCVVIASPSIAREVLKDHDATFANRGVNVAAGDVALYGGADIVFAPYGPEWRMMRKVCALKMLSNTALDSVQELRHKQVRKAVGYFYSRVGSPVDVGEQLFVAILNLTTNMLWGGTMEEEGVGAGVLAEFREAMRDIAELSGKPNISELYPGLARFDLQGIAKQMKDVELRFDRIFEKVINQRLTMQKEGAKESNDFLTFLLRSIDEGGDGKTPLTMTHLKAMLLDMVVGSTDTSATTIEFAMAEIMNKPVVLQKAQKELDVVVGKDSIVQESHIHKLPYLDAVMKETLRLHPALPVLIPHCPSETCTVGGYTIPKGSRIFVNVWDIHRDSSNWKNPLEFNPERFLNGKYDYTGSDFNYFPFGSGKRICPGIATAERLVMHLLASLLHSFDWKLPQGQTKLDVSEKFGLVMKKKVPMVAIPTPRLLDSELYQ